MSLSCKSLKVWAEGPIPYSRYVPSDTIATSFQLQIIMGRYALLQGVLLNIEIAEGRDVGISKFGYEQV